MRRRRKSIEDEAVERESASEFRYDLAGPRPAPPVVREAAALPMSRSTSHGDDYLAPCDRVVGELRQLLYSLDEQQQDIVRFRNETRVALAGMGAR